MSGQKSSSSTPVLASGTTGTIVPNTGPYKYSGPIDITVFLARGQRFPGSPFPPGVTVSGLGKNNAAEASWTMVADVEASPTPGDK